MRPDAFLTAYDPSDLPGTSLDPLGFERGYLFLADRILPGLTNVANRPRYFGMMSAALELAPDQAAGSRRQVYQARLEVLQRFERLWALANVLARPEESASGLRGVSYARQAATDLQEKGAGATDGGYKLLSRQVRYGAVGIYGPVGDGFRLFDRQTLTLTPGRGERLGEAFLDETQAPGPVKHAARDGTPVKLATLEAWGERCHLEAETGAEERACLREALEENHVRLRMARRLAQVPRQEDEPEQARLARSSRPSATIPTTPTSPRPSAPSSPTRRATGSSSSVVERLLASLAPCPEVTEAPGRLAVQEQDREEPFPRLRA